MLILADLVPGVNLSPESIATIAVGLFTLLGTSYKVLMSIVDKFMTRIEAQEKRAAEREKEIREAALGQMSEMRADFSRNVEVVESRHADERQQRETVFAASYGTLAESILKLNDENITIFKKLDTDIGGITEQFTKPGEGVKAKLDVVIQQLTDFRQHFSDFHQKIDSIKLQEIQPFLTAIQMTLIAIQNKPQASIEQPPGAQVAESDKKNGQDHQGQPALTLGE